jgi:hypothetical protein
MNRGDVSQPVKAAFLFVFLNSYLGIFSISKILNPHRVVMIRIFQYFLFAIRTCDRKSGAGITPLSD